MVKHKSLSESFVSLSGYFIGLVWSLYITGFTVYKIWLWHFAEIGNPNMIQACAFSVLMTLTTHQIESQKLSEEQRHPLWFRTIANTFGTGIVLLAAYILTKF